MTKLAVVVPTVNRAGMLEALVANIHAATATKHRVYLVMETDDQESIRVAERLDTIDVIGEFGSNATAVNGGYWAATEPFLALLNDDVVCHPGWDTAALAYMSDTIHIVGLNQGDGRCTSFSMIRRAFIEEHSGVFDKPNTLYHEYVSQYPDTEFSEYAKHRGVWADAPDALIEHMHWVFGKGDVNHPNYQKAIRTHDGDHAAFVERCRQWA